MQSLCWSNLWQCLGGCGRLWLGVDTLCWSTRCIRKGIAVTKCFLCSYSLRLSPNSLICPFTEVKVFNADFINKKNTTQIPHAAFLFIFTMTQGLVLLVYVAINRKHFDKAKTLLQRQRKFSFRWDFTYLVQILNKYKTHTYMHVVQHVWVQQVYMQRCNIKASL